MWAETCDRKLLNNFLGVIKPEVAHVFLAIGCIVLDLNQLVLGVVQDDSHCFKPVVQVWKNALKT